MTARPLSWAREVWAVDFEYHAPDGERPAPLCMIARELRAGRVIRMWWEELESAPAPPFPTGPDVLFVAYYVSAELGCFLALGWPFPERILDLCAEFKLLSSGLEVPAGRGLLGALTYFGLDGIAAGEKDAGRALAIRGGPYSAEERQTLLSYCQSDVDALERLLPLMLPRIDLPYALLRGRYMAAAAQIEWAGVPIDVETWKGLKDNWTTIKGKLIERVDGDYRVYPNGVSFSMDRFADYLTRAGIPWPRTDTGRLALDDDTFRQMAKAHPTIAPLRELRHALSELRLLDLAVGSDGRNRCLLGAFGSKTGRNQPSNTRFIFGPSVWLRSLIWPAPGQALAYVDYAQQEFAIAAALSGDQAMIEAYKSGDPYLAFAIQAGAAPPGATKQTHLTVRERFKQCALAVQYGMGSRSLAGRIGQSEAHAQALLDLHHQTYPTFWRWSDAAVDRAILTGSISTVYGWRIHVDRRTTDRTLRNFPMQANGAEILRLAACLTTEQGIRVCALIHDALLVKALVEDIDRVVVVTRGAMEEAGRQVLNGFQLWTEAKVIRHPDRYWDERGETMWRTVLEILGELGVNLPCGAEGNPPCGPGGTPRVARTPYSLIL